MILVTGGSGLVGQHLLSALTEAGHRVRAICRNPIHTYYTPIQNQQVEWMYGDILDISFLEDAFDDIDIVYHCAALVSYDPQDADALMQTNVNGTANIVNACLDAQVKTLCYVSSIAAIGEPKAEELRSEQCEWKASQSLSNYARSKHAAEMEVWRGVAEGLDAIIVNPGIILGEGDKNQSSTRLFTWVEKEFPYYTQGSTAWVDVKDVVKIMMLLMEKQIVNERFILSAGDFSYQDIFSRIAKILQKKPPYKKAGPTLSAFVWRWQWLRQKLGGPKAMVTRETARSAQESKQYDNQKLLSHLPDFQYTRIDESLQRIIHYLRTQPTQV